MAIPMSASGNITFPNSGGKLYAHIALAAILLPPEQFQASLHPTNAVTGRTKHTSTWYYAPAPLVRQHSGCQTRVPS